ncbi:ABC-type sugar transport system, permease component [Halobacteroides halobius DSM 5150]|uniref:ABC-type sugar transport system, permease component n=1 Tax=Halobacteroides halobius (strain ATCC 35273 / DSM 5150 / MD-1) TaxID=748449 RepID=L0K7A2_HALHC|nr:carbohydrate ABC transporter permease [Halobacteroides halobius]AGB40244.1 ABC-type sugar transport system, permease component [Halobacteroides halobius DSM 5150]
MRIESKLENKLNLTPKQKKIGKKTGLYLVLILGSFVVMYPFFFMIMNSFKEGTRILHAPNALPKQLSLQGYIGVFKSLNIPRLFFNSTFIACSVTFLNVLCSAMVAYGIIKTDVPGKKILFRSALGSMMLPPVLLLVPKYMMMYNWGWINTYRVMIFPVMLSGYNIFLVMQFMRQLDDAYLEAARIDGANEWQVFWKVALPMVKPGLATVTILTFMGSWNDFIRPLLYIRNESLMTLQLALYRFQTSIPGKNIEQLWAATTLISIPVVIVFFFLQKNFVKAFTGVGLK